MSLTVLQKAKYIFAGIIHGSIISDAYLIYYSYNPMQIAQGYSSLNLNKFAFFSANLLFMKSYIFKNYQEDFSYYDASMILSYRVGRLVHYLAILHMLDEFTKKTYKNKNNFDCSKQEESTLKLLKDLKLECSENLLKQAFHQQNQKTLNHYASELLFENLYPSIYSLGNWVGSYFQNKPYPISETPTTLVVYGSNHIDPNLQAFIDAIHIAEKNPNLSFSLNDYITTNVGNVAYSIIKFSYDLIEQSGLVEPDIKQHLN